MQQQQQQQQQQQTQTQNISKEHVNLITDLVSSDAQIASVIRTVYENKQQESFLESIEQFLEENQAEIEKICNFHYEDFINSVNESLLVKEESTQLRCELDLSNRQLQRQEHIN